MRTTPSTVPDPVPRGSTGTACPVPQQPEGRFHTPDKRADVIIERYTSETLESELRLRSKEVSFVHYSRSVTSSRYSRQ